ncbi:MAG: DUF3592 domain-containing protein [Rhizobiaceae bacterium]
METGISPAEAVFFWVVLAGVGALIFIGVLNNRRIIRRAAIWPEYLAVIVERRSAGESPGYNHRVSYFFDDTQYASWVFNVYQLPKIYNEVGDHLLVRVNPERPQQCILMPGRHNVHTPPPQGKF